MCRRDGRTQGRRDSAHGAELLTRMSDLTRDAAGAGGALCPLFRRPSDSVDKTCGRGCQFGRRWSAELLHIGGRGVNLTLPRLGADV